MARKHLTLTVAVVVCLLFAISYLLPTSTTHHATYESISSSEQPAIPLKEASSGSKSEFQIDLDVMPVGILEGESIAPKLENATLKYATTLAAATS
jgi:FAD-linked sulfhydryl oxidase